MTTSAEIWTIQRLLHWSVGYLTGKMISDTPRLDAELLLAHALGVSRVYLYTHFDRVLTAIERDPFRAALLRRGQGEPIAYILGTKEFLGHTFEVTPAVLIPRPDTEIVVEAAIEAAGTLSLAEGESLSILDIGTGSGCIAIALALALPHARITAWDIYPEALTVAQRNATKLGAQQRITFQQRDALQSDAWETLSANSFHLIVSNPPYIAHGERPALSSSVVAFEPHSALFADEEGLIFYRQLATHAADALHQEGKLVLEIGSSQSRDVSKILTIHGWVDAKVLRDLGRNDRCIVACHPCHIPLGHSQCDTELGEDASACPEPPTPMKSSVHPSSPGPQERAGAKSAGEPTYVALVESPRALEGATRQYFTTTPSFDEEVRSADATQVKPESTYIPLDAFGRPRRTGATKAAPIEYVTQVLSGEEEDLLTEYASENASDVEIEP